jgi:hypothetical protein
MPVDQSGQGAAQAAINLHRSLHGSRVVTMKASRCRERAML